MKTTEQRILKTNILEACISKQLMLREDFKVRIKHILKHEGLGNEESYDNTELSQESERFAEINALNESLSFVISDLNILYYLATLKDIPHTIPQPGAIVVTNHGKFFISVSVGQVVVNNETFTTLSPKSQLFRMMNEKVSGESFEFNRVKHTIEDIF